MKEGGRGEPAWILWADKDLFISVSRKWLSEAGRHLPFSFASLVPPCATPSTPQVFLFFFFFVVFVPTMDGAWAHKP